MRILLLKAALLVCLLTAVTASAAQSETLRVTVGDNTVTVTGITPGESVIIFCVTRETHDYVPLVRRYQAVVTDTERAGTVTFQPQDGIAPESIIAAVELNSGRMAIGSRGNFVPRQLADDGRGVGRGITGELTRLQKRGQFFQLLVVRPGVGAWNLITGDGGPSDHDHASDRAVTIDVDQLVAVEGASAPVPKQFRPGDVVIGVETHEFAYFVAGVRP